MRRGGGQLTRQFAVLDAVRRVGILAEPLFDCFNNFADMADEGAFVAYISYQLSGQIRGVVRYAAARRYMAIVMFCDVGLQYYLPAQS